jgi:phosphoribulokinase
MVAVGGDSASGKTTLARGLVEAIGPDRCSLLCTDDYHRFDRCERRSLPFTATHPDGNYIDIMEQHLQMLATGEPILKPVYDHSSGTFGRQEYLAPREFVVVEGLFPLFTKLARACFDVSVFLDPPEELRHRWKIDRDVARRGYTRPEVVVDLERREPESAAFIRPQRRYADMVVRFGPRPEDLQAPGNGLPLPAELLLRPSAHCPSFGPLLTEATSPALRLEIRRDEDGTPVDCLHVEGGADPGVLRAAEAAIWTAAARSDPLPAGLGDLGGGRRSGSLALTQLVLVHQVLKELHLV